MVRRPENSGVVVDTAIDTLIVVGRDGTVNPSRILSDGERRASMQDFERRMFERNRVIIAEALGGFPMGLATASPARIEEIADAAIELGLVSSR